MPATEVAQKTTTVVIFENQYKHPVIFVDPNRGRSYVAEKSADVRCNVPICNSLEEFRKRALFVYSSGDDIKILGYVWQTNDILYHSKNGFRVNDGHRLPPPQHSGAGGPIKLWADPNGQIYGEPVKANA